MFKTLILTMIFSLNAMADVNVVCKDNCSAVAGSSVVSNTDTQTVLRVSPIPDELISVQTSAGAPKKRIIVDIDDESQPGSVTLNLASKLDLVDQKSYDASNGLVVAGYLKSVNVNTSGYRGANGKSAANLCADKIIDGTYDNTLGTGTTIHSYFVGRRGGDPSLSMDKCDAADISFIKAQIAPENTSGVSSPMCSTGYLTDSTSTSSSNFSLRRISPKRACINNPSTGRMCRFRKHQFQCGFGFGSVYGLWPTQINGDGTYPRIYWAQKRVYAPFYSIGSYQRGSDMAALNYYYDYGSTGQSCHERCRTGTRVDGWADNYMIQTLGEKYYEERYSATDCSDLSCTVDQFRKSEVNLRAQNYCAAAWYIGYGMGCYGSTEGSCQLSANWVKGWPGTAANAFYLGVQTINEISSSASESCDAMAVRKGYQGTYTTEDLGPAVGANTTWYPESSSCPAGFTNAGTYNDFSTCTDGSGAANCDGVGDEDSINCSISGCNGGKMIVNNKTFAPVQVTLEDGEKGSNFGTATVISFYLSGTISSTVLSGADGNIGLDDLNVIGEAKVCKMIEDEDAYDSLSPAGKLASKTSSYRSNPRVFIENVNLKPLDVIGISSPKSTYQNPKADQNKVFTHVDNNVRKLILKEAQ